MRISTFFYTLKQGIINIFRNKWFSLASVATISACLFLFGLFYAVITNFQSIVKSAYFSSPALPRNRSWISVPKLKRGTRFPK